MTKFTVRSIENINKSYIQEIEAKTYEEALEIAQNEWHRVEENEWDWDWIDYEVENKEWDVVYTTL